MRGEERRRDPTRSDRREAETETRAPARERPPCSGEEASCPSLRLFERAPAPPANLPRPSASRADPPASCASPVGRDCEAFDRRAAPRCSLTPPPANLT